LLACASVFTNCRTLRVDLSLSSAAALSGCAFGAVTLSRKAFRALPKGSSWVCRHACSLLDCGRKQTIGNCLDVL